MTKPKNNTKAPQKDKCQTPPYAIDPLVPYLGKFKFIWEPATGEGLLTLWLSRALDAKILATDIVTGHDFFKYEMPLPYDCIITNPPFSLKFPWLKRCYALGKPFALLMPSDAMFAEKAQKMFSEYGIDVLLMTPRVDYKMPNVGWGGAAQFSTAWFTYNVVQTTKPGISVTMHDIRSGKKEFQRMLKENPDGF